MKVVVTGGAGRLGRSVVAGLAERGHEVVSVDLRAFDGTVPDGVVERQVDLTDPDGCAQLFAEVRPDGLVHLAGIAVPFAAPERHIFTTNATIAFTTLQAAVDHGIRRILVASSPTPLGYGSPHGWLPRYLPIDEDHPLLPWNAYALSKQTIEQTVAMFSAQTGGAVRLGVIRPCFVISPEEWRGAPTQQGHTVRERLDDPALAAVSLFNYVDARDAAGFIDTWLAAAEQLPGGEVFYVGAADAMARKPLAELMPLYHPGTDRLAAGLTGTAPAFSIAKAERLLGWRPERSWRTELVDHDHPHA
ncbi:NAD-dependent epimerase/dehydratase family protein [Microlunatus parietis]|uniref:Nucleoside-diphosphate-sugar epimerase n=1 Tax=Microlunatus parietis TaxID=682979 RepID=A0A7Y9LDN6_9ACTN|nr:NAD(P)-dependent oxidoreductase [Microlunatus parietis]NYE73063.1 nucleoside-diphosphate-sugar epimerase [Microlunatus parietis]